MSNAGPSTAENVTTRDVLPAEFYAPAPVPTGTFTGGGTRVWLPLVRNMRCAIDSFAPGQAVSCALGGLSAGASDEFGIDVRVDSSQAGQVVPNTASVASAPADP